MRFCVNNERRLVGAEQKQCIRIDEENTKPSLAYIAGKETRKEKERIKEG